MSVAARKTILVVGDDPTIQQLLTSLQSATELDIDNARDEVECLMRVRASAYDLVITDPKTSGADDVELLKQIRAVRPETKVLVLTEETAPEDIVKLIREHAFSHFCKPLNSAAITEMIAKALDIAAWDDGIEVISARPNWLTLRLRCQMLTADRLLQFMREMRTDLPAAERDNIANALREMLLNAMEHGAGFDPRQKIQISYIRTRQVILYHIQDPGAGFSIDSLPHAAISNAPDDPVAHIIYRNEHGLRPGGFGILITRNYVDEQIYNETGNEVLLIKYLH